MGFRPSGAPFWGESMRLHSAKDVVGSALGSSGFSMLAYRGAPQASLVAGDQINAWVNAGNSYLYESDDVVWSWVIECSGSGTLSVKEGIDASGSPGSVTVPAPPDDLGTHVVSGTTTLVLESSYTSADYYHPTDWLVAVSLIECVSGSVQIQQVKMRIFPPGGPVGGLSAPIAGDAGSGNGAIYYGLWDATSGTQEGTDFEGLWDVALPIAQSSFASGPVAGAAVASPGSVASGSNYVDRSGSWAVGGVLDGEAGAFVGSAGLQRVMAWITRPDVQDQLSTPATGAERTDWIRNPYEVAGDPVAFCQATAPVDVTWKDLELAYLVTGGFSGINVVVEESSGPPSFFSGATRWPTIGSVLESFAVSEGTGWLPLDDYPAKSIRLSLYPSVATGSPSAPTPDGDPGTGQSAGDNYSMGVRTIGTDSSPDWPGSSARCQYRFQRAPYRVWSPVPPPEVEELEQPVVIDDGYFLTPTPVLAGVADRVDVNFA